MLERGTAALAAAACVLIVALWLRGVLQRVDGAPLLATRHTAWAAALGRALREGRLDADFGGRRLLLASASAGAFVGFSLLDVVGFCAGLLLGPLLVRALLKARRRRRAAQIDACAADFAQALAAALAAGRSVRGALVVSSGATPEPLRGELERALVDLALGGSVHEALRSLRQRTDSRRLESLAGAVELHSGSGGDLVKLMRELAEAFRGRDRALRDAHAASAQARFTSYVVAGIPVGTLALLELASPGMVSGAVGFVPSAVMLAASAALLAAGVLLAQRTATVRA